MKTLKERLEESFLNKSFDGGKFSTAISIRMADALEAALSVLPQWQTIDKLPEEYKDGREILVWWHKGKTHSVVEWDTVTKCWRDASDCMEVGNFKYWMELLEGPGE